MSKGESISDTINIYGCYRHAYLLGIDSARISVFKCVNV